MRFVELYIHAYGCLRDQRLRLGDGLNVVFGPNESGKSTLKDFVETMLYSFSPADETHPYRPWTPAGRDFGGELAYELETEGAFRVRRHLELRGRRVREAAEVRVGLEGGGATGSIGADAVGEVHVRQRRSIWRNVFAIDLAALVDASEMSRSDRMHLEQVFFREMAALGSIVNPKTILQEMAEELAGMRLRQASGRRKKGEIDKFRLSELLEARSEVRRARERHGRVRELREEIESLEAELRAAHRRRAELNARIEVSTRRMPLRELFFQWQQARHLLNEAGDARCDEQVAAQLAADLAHKDGVAGSLSRSEGEVGRLRAKVETLRGTAEADAVLIEQATAIESLARQVDDVERRRKEWLAADHSLQEERNRLAEVLRSLGRAADPRSSSALRMTAEEADGLLAEADRWAVLEGQFADAERQVAQLAEQHQGACKRAEELRKRVPEDMPNEYRPSLLHEAVELGRLFDAVEAHRAQATELAERLKDEDARLGQIRRRVADESGRTKAAAPTAWNAAGVAALVLGAAAAAYYFWQGQIDAALWPSALGASGIGLLVYVFRRRRGALMAEDLVQESELLKGQLQRLAALQQRKQAHDERLASLNEKLREGWAALSLPGSPARKAWDERLARLRRFDDARAEAVTYEATVRQRDELQHRLEAASAHHQALRDERKTLVAELRNRAAQFDLAWEKDLAPNGARRLVLSAARAASQWHSLAEARRRLDVQRVELEDFESRYNSLWTAVGQLHPADGGPADCLARWDAALQAARRRQQERERAEVQLRDGHARLKGVREAAEDVEQRIAKACEQLAIADPQELPRAREHARRLERLRHEERTLAEAFERQRRLARLPEGWTPESPSEGPAEQRAPAQPHGDDAETVGHAELLALRDEEEARLANLQERLRSMQTLFEEQAAGPSIAMATGAMEAAYDKLAALCERHDVLLVAHGLLSRALAEFQQERQPRIIHRAQHYLARLTAGHRRRLEADLLSEPRISGGTGEPTPLHLVPESGEPWPVAHFSRGAREQAYLAMRLALADDLDADERLPLILDDVLANFDDERAAAAAATLVELSQARQLVYLTCHERMLELLEGAGGRVLTLQTPEATREAPAPITANTRGDSIEARGL